MYLQKLPNTFKHLQQKAAQQAANQPPGHHFSLQQLTLDKLVHYGLEVVGALVILVVGWTLANLVARWLKKWLGDKEHFDPTLVPVIADTIKVVILAITIIMVLSRFGVQTASLVALVGSLAIGIGLALQGTFSDIASGILLLTIRPFNSGDAVHLNGDYGVIDKIGLFITEMHTYNGVYWTMPNSIIWKNQIQNYSRRANRRIDLTIPIHRDSDMDKAMRVITEIAEADERVLKDPALLVAVRGLSESSIDILVRPWTAPGDWWATQLAMYESIKKRFDEEGIILAYPKRDLHFSDQKNGAPPENKETAK
jgi:small conductance mechanosensitive channel